MSNLFIPRQFEHAIEVLRRHLAAAWNQRRSVDPNSTIQIAERASIWDAFRS